MSERKGTYWRIAWSKDWFRATPWSFNGKNMPYIGKRTEPRAVTMRTLGPVAILSINLDLK